MAVTLNSAIYKFIHNVAPDNFFEKHPREYPMNIIIKALFIVLITHVLAIDSLAGWIGPQEIVEGGWGSEVGDFGFRHGDSGDSFPSLEGILFNGNIHIEDYINERIAIYGSDGRHIKDIPWFLGTDGTVNPDYKFHQYSNIQGYTLEGHVWYKINNYILKDNNGNILQKTKEMPLELGQLVKEEKIGSGRYLSVIVYKDTVFRIITAEMLEYFGRDLSGHLYGVILVGPDENLNYRVMMYDKNGTELGHVDMPTDNIISAPETIPPRPTPQLTYVAEYGKPVIASNGDVYIQKRSTNTYAILKWTWKD
jgi:hypothetical protein